MNSFAIPALSNQLTAALRHKMDTKTKPLASLGKLEQVALQIGRIQETLTPSLEQPALVVFAADHGIVAQHPVSKYPQEVTWQMVQNFLNGGAAINVLAKQHGIDLTIVDAGVNHDFGQIEGLLSRKVGLGTKSYLDGPAMTLAEAEIALTHGAQVVTEITKKGTNIIGFGEMGIGNTSSASLLFSAFTDTPLTECVGAGTGLDTDGQQAKIAILQRVEHRHGIPSTPMEKLATFGGFEIAMLCGALLQAAELKCVILIDGFIVSSALLVAAALHPEVLDYCIFTHQSNEQGHAKLLKHLQADPLLQLDLRLGEGSGVATCYPLICSAVHLLNQMASFESAQVSDCTSSR